MDMSKLRLSLVICTLLAELIPSQAIGGGAPFIANISSRTYGPDGPWYAATLVLGQSQLVDLFPGGTFQSSVMGPSICDGQPSNSSNSCLAARGGIYTPVSGNSSGHSSSSSDYYEGESEDGEADTPVQFAPSPDFAKPLNVQGTAKIYLEDTQILTSTPIIQNSSFLVMSDVDCTLPNGTVYPVTLGTLSFGAPSVNQSFGGGVDGSINATFPTSGLFLSGQIPSASISWHAGSASLDIVPSLIYGGYDQNRVIEPVITLSNQPPNGPERPPFMATLLDISIAVAEGGSPFPYSSKRGLLQTTEKSSAGGTEVSIDSSSPYLSLPPPTCDAITADLPVHLDPGTGLYLWDTNDPNYAALVNSASYLSFTFQNNGNPANVSINVPWKLLNLTLSAPILGTPTPYFPCYRYDGLVSGKTQYTLGRAFLQAAFFGVNWRPQTSDGSWFLAQAPGPNVGTTNLRSIHDGDTTLAGSSMTWEQSWKNRWTPLAGAVASPSARAVSGLTIGARAGVGAGAAIGGALVLGGVVAGFVWKMRVSRKVTHSEQSHLPPRYQELHDNGSDAKEVYVKHPTGNPDNANTIRVRQELEGDHIARRELPS